MLSGNYRQSFLGVTKQVFNAGVLKNSFFILFFVIAGTLTLLSLSVVQHAKAQDKEITKTIYFPRLHLGQGWKTTISITNADDKDLSLTFTARDQLGGAQSVITPLSRAEEWLLRIHGQKSLEQRFNLTRLAAGQTNTISLESMPIGTESLEIKSDGNVIGTAIFQSIDGKKAETLPAVRETARTLIFPPLSQGDLTHKNLLLFNPNQNETTAELIALDELGNEVVRRHLLPFTAFESRAIATSELLADHELQNTMAVKVVSDHSLVGWQIVSSPDTDILGMHALTAAGKKWGLPVLSKLGVLELWNQYAIFNPGNEPAKLMVELFDTADKHLLTVNLPDLPPDVTSFFNNQVLQKYTTSNVAYLSVISDQPVQCYEIVGANLGQGLTAISGAIEEEKRTNIIEIVGDKFGGALSAHTCSRTEDSDLMPLFERGSDNNWQKEFISFKQKALDVATVSNNFDPVNILPFAFAPAQVHTLAASSYAISGKVTLGGNGRQGVPVSLIGATSKTISTDNTGKYSFAGLPNGSYTLKPSKSSYTFDPTSSSVTVAGGNVANKNFIAKTISSEQPDLKAPWAGKAKISQGNQGSVSHNVCGKRSIDGSGCIWENTYALDINMGGKNFNVLAPASGVISFIKDDVGSCSSGCLGGREIGLKVTGASGKTFEIIFLHLSVIKKKKDDAVRQGDVIAISGSSSNNSEAGTSPHLHMHIWDSDVGSRDSHTMPISRLWMKKNGDVNFKFYESKGDGDDDSSRGNLDNSTIAGQEFWSDQPDYEGFLDAVDCNKISGWAWDRNKPNNPVTVNIYDGNILLASQVLADIFRQDLVNAGKGNGKHGFSYTVPQNIKDGRAHSISVRFLNTDDLTYSPKSFTFTCGGTTPAVSYFRINNDAASTSIRNVTLNSTATGSPTQYIASESSSFSGASWQAYSAAPGFTLSSGNGNKVVYFKVRNSTNVESGVANDSIILNESLPLPTITRYSWDRTPIAGQFFNGTISGTNFISGGTLVFFCVSGTSACYQQPPSLVNVTSSTSLNVSNTNLSGGLWQIYVQTSAGLSVRSLPFTVQAPPTISTFAWNIVPTAGQPFGGTISGENFISGGTQVFFCVASSSVCYQQPAPLVSVVSSKSLSVSSVNLSKGAWQIYVQTLAGQSARSIAFTVR